jgi:pimeloyl-ACP methyl ester carboxylesterase
MKPTRVVALALIAILVGGLVFLRFGAGPDEVVVPDGARAGELGLEPCEYTTEDGDHAADCGTLVVPENRSDPGSRLIALPVIKIRAKNPSAEPIFHLEGGPGLSNMDFPTANRFLDDRDVVLVGYRGVDGSSVLDCPEVTAALKHSRDFLGEDSFRAYTDAFRTCATRLTDEGVDLAGYSLSQRVDDLEAARVALGYDRVDLLGESTGTRTAQIYSWRHPDSIHRSVMIGVNPPGHFGWDPATTDDLIRHYARLCAEDTDCRTRTDDLANSMARTAEQMPDNWGFFNIKPGTARVAAFFGLFDSSADATIPAPTTVDSWLSAAEGDPSGLWFSSLLAGLVFPSSFVWGEYAAIGTSDAWAFGSRSHQDSILGDPGTDFLWAGGRFADAWPTSPDDAEYRAVRTSEVETLLIGGTLDFSAPAVNATEELLPFLPNGHQVVLAELGHTTDFWAHQPDAGRRLIGTFLDSGRVDDSLYRTAKVDFTPSVTHPALAKIILGVMIGFTLIMVLSLALMARRVRRRGGFGPKASAALRSVFPLVLGLGGWFLAALVILTLLPGVPLDDELASALSVGLPVGLGIHLAWTRRDRARNVRTIGLVAAVAGALVGAWLGFHATEGLLALLTTIAGATAAANLVLLALDITWERPGAAGTSRPLPGSSASR